MSLVPVVVRYGKMIRNRSTCAALCAKSDDDDVENDDAARQRTLSLIALPLRSRLGGYVVFGRLDQNANAHANVCVRSHRMKTKNVHADVANDVTTTERIE